MGIEFRKNFSAERACAARLERMKRNVPVKFNNSGWIEHEGLLYPSYAYEKKIINDKEVVILKKGLYARLAIDTKKRT